MPSSPRAFTTEQFNRVYADRVLGGGFFEFDAYYEIYRNRYLRSLRYIAGLPLPRPAEILEIGGGQIALLSQALFGDRVTVGDVNDKWSERLRAVGVDFLVCDLLHDELPPERTFDLIVLLEVVEHLPLPLHIVMRRLVRHLRPGGYVFITTPNLYRFRNVMRMLAGRELFAYWRHPERGQPMGHVLEFDRDHLAWQLEQSGLTDVRTILTQLSYRGASLKTTLLRALSWPTTLRPLWRDSLVAFGRKPVDSTTGERAPEPAPRETSTIAGGVT